MYKFKLEFLRLHCTNSIFIISYLTFLNCSVKFSIYIFLHYTVWKYFAKEDNSVMCNIGEDILKYNQRRRFATKIK